MTAHITKTWFDGEKIVTQNIPESEIYKPEWVGLTQIDVDSWDLPDCPTVFEFAQFVEAKLKEMNT